MRRRLPIALATAVVFVSSAGYAVAVNEPPDSYLFVARGDNPADALGASSLAGRLDAPMVLTRTTSLPDPSATAIVEADPDVVFVLGGEGAINADVFSTITAIAPDADVQRISGTDRFDTASQIAAKFPELASAFLATDGKANDSELLGGLPPEAYGRIDSTRTNATDGAGPIYDAYTGTQGELLTIEELTVTVPADGHLLIGSALLLAADENVAVNIYTTVDQPLTSATTASALESIYNSASHVDVASFLEVDRTAGGSIVMPRAHTVGGVGTVPVTAGEHVVRLQMYFSNDGQTINHGLSHLWAQFVPFGEQDFTPIDITP